MRTIKLTILAFIISSLHSCEFLDPVIPIYPTEPNNPIDILDYRVLTRINCGGQKVTQGDITFDADNFDTNGGSYSNLGIPDIANTEIDDIYKTERNQDVKYAFPVTENGLYIVKLHFAEIYFGATGGGNANADNNNRVFDVKIEEIPVLTNFNINQEVGPMTALVKTFAASITDKEINIDFNQIADQAKISAIEILGYGSPEIVEGPCVWRDNLADANHNHIEGQTATVNGKLYLFGGFEPAPENIGKPGTPLFFANNTEIYDPASDTWTDGAPMPTPLSHGGMQAVGDDIWIIGGFLGDNGGRGTDLVQIYNTTTNTWRTGPSIPNKRASVAAVFVGGRIHIFGGYSEDREGNIDEHYYYDLNNESAGWQELAPLPVARGHHGGAVANGIIYSIGGQDGHNSTNRGNINNVEAYNFITNQWTNVRILPEARSHFELGTLTHNGKIMIAGGNTGANDILQYNPILNEWSEYCNLPNAMLTPTMMVSGGKLIVTCGGLGNNWNPTKETIWVPITP